jgi:phospholipid-binding lipoprotein MlaA
MFRPPLAQWFWGFAFSAVVAGFALFGASGAVAQQPTPTPAASPPDDSNDPWEKTNRAIFGFNQSVDRTVLVPVANGYRAVLPSTVRDMLHDFLQNLDSPTIFANDVLQAQPGLAGVTFGRALLNTTVGFGGIIDVASKFGVPYHTNDFGITLATWGVDSGPYLMLPVLGPSNPRDLVGTVADGFGDPGNIVASDYHYIWATFARAAVQGIDERSRNIENLAEIERTSLDYYATIRSLARQRRAAQIHHQREDVPNAAPLQGSGTPPPSVPTHSIAALPTTSAPAMTYQMAPTQSPPPASAARSLGDLQRSSMAPSPVSGH